jgi:large subunit ribosomal protein L5
MQNNNIEKIVINAGVGRLASQPNFNEKILPELMKEFSLITGQKPAPRPIRQSISGFKMRAGTIVGLKATLRRKRAEQFLKKLVKIVFPRVRDFRGLNLKNVDKNGNLTVGLKEHIVFPEINPEHSNVNFGVEITIVPKDAENREEAIRLYRELGIPLKQK